MNNQSMDSDSLDEIKIIKLKDGREIQLVDDDGLSIVLFVDSEIEDSISLPYPSSGYAGGSIYSSPSESMVLFTFYSGQSEEAFTLLKLDKKLEILYESGYRFGEAASYCFTEDETKLIQTLRLSCTYWWPPEDEDLLDMEQDEHGEMYLILGYINVLELATKKLYEHEIRVKPTRGWKPNKKNYHALLSPQDLGQGKLSISCPWGTEILELPLPKIIVCEL